jgi:hypothetical protein
MILQRLTQEAESASVRYGMLTEAWRSIFHSALNASDFGAPAASDRAIEEAYVIAKDYLAEEREAVTRIFAEIARDAHQRTKDELRSVDASELSDDALEHLSATESYLIDELVAQIHRDVALLRQTIQRVVLEVSIASRSRGVSQRMALVEYRIGNQADLQFVFHDRQARKWASKKFVRAMWRHTALAVYNETVLMTLAEHGVTRAQVQHEDEKSDVHGKVIAMGSNSYFPTYSEIRNEIFHPNANAILRMEHADVQA